MFIEVWLPKAGLNIHAFIFWAHVKSQHVIIIILIAVLSLKLRPCGIGLVMCVLLSSLLLLLVDSRIVWQHEWREEWRFSVAQWDRGTIRAVRGVVLRLSHSDSHISYSFLSLSRHRCLLIQLRSRTYNTVHFGLFATSSNTVSFVLRTPASVHICYFKKGPSSVTEALVLRYTKDRGRITESIRILVPVNRIKQDSFQITTNLALIYLFLYSLSC